MHKPYITKELVAWFVIVTIFLLIVGQLPEKIYDGLATPHFKLGKWGIDWWYISHFWFYMIVGATCPGNFWLYMTIGGLFEVMETGMGIVGLHMQSERAKKQHEKHYWFGRWEDVVVNALGYIVGEWSSTGKFNL